MTKSTWVRNATGKPETRRLVLIYKPTKDTQYAEIESLLEHIPYGDGNKTLLECLRYGAAQMLAQMKAKGPGALATEAAPQRPPAAPPPPAPRVASPPPAPPPAPAPGPAADHQVDHAADTTPTYSNAAVSMLQMGDSSSKRHK